MAIFNSFLYVYQRVAQVPNDLDDLFFFSPLFLKAKLRYVTMVLFCYDGFRCYEL